jgi:hypothetical protein
LENANFHNHKKKGSETAPLLEIFSTYLPFDLGAEALFPDLAGAFAGFAADFAILLIFNVSLLYWLFGYASI